jgi:hypothetical protein
MSALGQGSLGDEHQFRLVPEADISTRSTAIDGAPGASRGGLSSRKHRDGDAGSREMEGLECGPPESLERFGA